MRVRPTPAAVMGSSPRMRGKPVAQLAQTLGLGLIPAHAGKTPCLRDRSARKKAHPRACGENGLHGRHERRLRGSSPRMRGKPSAITAGRPTARLIPAHAGKTRFRKRSPRRRRAHPRACGENFHVRRIAPPVTGSSPRMRGKRLPAVKATLHHGLIPAHAGKTNLLKSRRLQSRAHPRACGENRVT